MRIKPLAGNYGETDHLISFSADQVISVRIDHSISLFNSELTESPRIMAGGQSATERDGQRRRIFQITRCASKNIQLID